MKLTLPETLFFCFGPPKSGTTFLQRTLNLHPQVSCPSEHQFELLIKNLEQFYTRYNQQLLLVDKRTGGQGATLINSNTLNSIFTHSVISIIRQSARNKPIIGANDNAILNKLAFYNSLFRQPKLIAIFRNPIDTGISAWHHNLRLAKEENDPSHEHLMSRHGGFDDWLKFIAKRFQIHVLNCKKFSETNDNMLIIRYEDLSQNKDTVLLRLFTFLGAATDSATIEKIIAQSDIDAMRKSSAAPAFFRAGQTKMGNGEVSEALRDEIFSIARHALAYLNYL